MAMGTRKQRERQADLWFVTSDIVQTPGHVFYERLNAVLRAHRFDAKVEHLCRRFCRGQYGRPSLAPGAYIPAAAGRLLRGAGLGAGTAQA